MLKDRIFPGGPRNLSSREPYLYPNPPLSRMCG